MLWWESPLCFFLDGRCYVRVHVGREGIIGRGGDWAKWTGWEKWDGGGNLNVHWGLMRMEVWIRLGGWGGWR